MERRLFLQLPLAVSALLSQAQTGTGTPPAKGFKVVNKKDRYQEELLIMGGRFDCKVSAKDTNGALCIYDTYREEKGGPAVHLHYHQDEWFYVVKGAFIVKVGEETFQLKAGDSAFAPRQIAHAFAKISEGEAQMMVLFQPAGTMEDFFKKMAGFGKSVMKDQDKVLKDLWEAHGMKVLGPPLKF